MRRILTPRHLAFAVAAITGLAVAAGPGAASAEIERADGPGPGGDIAGP